MEVKLPIDPEAQKTGETECVNRKAYTLKVFAACPDERDSTPRLLGRVKIRPGPVAPGQIAAVKIPDGSLILRRIYYQREGSREFVRLVSLLPRTTSLHFPLSAICILGTVICCL
jgi:hypothetical protein